MRWQHFDELEADFQQYYNLDIADVKPARAARLFTQLPSNARVFVALKPANQWGWAEVLLNKIDYILEILAWQNANEGKKVSQQTEKPTIYIPEFMKDHTDDDTAVQDVDAVKSLLSKPRV